MLAIQTSAAGAEKNHVLGCGQPPAREEGRDGAAEPAERHMSSGHETAERFGSFAAYEQRRLLVNFTNAEPTVMLS